ncbi:MAG: hypothetical protein NVS3B12_08310 [Acidimicrobiales bacterium]
MRRQGRQGRFVARLMVATSCVAAVAPLGVGAAGASTRPGPLAAVGQPTPDGVPSAVIVRADAPGAARAAVTRSGGSVTLDLPIVDAVAASLGARSLARLAHDRSVVVIPDLPAHATGGSYGDAPADEATQGPALDQLAAIDLPPAAGTPAGTGVGVALVDTGIRPSPALTNLVDGIDLTRRHGSSLTDDFGHGTFMAGLIAGNGSSSIGPGVATGAAPGATLVSVKVAGRDGSTTMSKLIAGIGWTVEHRLTLRAAPIRVLNLSFGIDLGVAPAANPLDAAVEAAWASGITVVTAAGNTAGMVTSPGDDPWVITAGAVDTHLATSVAEATIPGWSGSLGTKPDVGAPGVSVRSLRAIGSLIDTNFWVQQSAPAVDDTYAHGTGTSMATALTSGAAALLVSHHPDATPDDVKGALRDGSVAAGERTIIDVRRADAAASRTTWEQHYPVAFDGLGIGLKTMPWTDMSWTGMSWTDMSWTGMSWTGMSWTGMSWTGMSWTDMSWTGMSWTDMSWTGMSWTDMSWTGMSWTDMSWT